MEAIANKINYMMTQIRLQAEKSLKVTARDWWHKDLVQWKSQLQQCNQVLKQLKKKISKLNEQIKTVLTEKNKLVTKFRQHIEQGYQIQHKLIQDDISTLCLEDPPKKPKIRQLKQILRNEQIREIYNKIKKKTMDSQNNQVKLQIQADDGQISTIEDPEHISRHIAQYNMTHFAQAKNTPLATYISEDSQFESVPDKSREYTLPHLPLIIPTIEKIVHNT
jgi:predicted RNase H-like nuclease (RuvC/YqgF family)